MLENKLGIHNQAELAQAEERISKQKARELFDSGDIGKAEIGSFAGLAHIHAYLFGDIYPFAGKLRDVNIAKGGFRFASRLYLEAALQKIDVIPQTGFDEIIEKYVEMNIAHPFREGNGRATRIWLDQMLKSSLQRVVDWQRISKEDYLSAMQRSPVNDMEIKQLLQNALTDQVNDRVVFLQGIDASYHYEGYTAFKTEDL